MYAWKIIRAGLLDRRWLAYLLVLLFFVVLIETGHASLPPFLFPSTREIVAGAFKALSTHGTDLAISLARFLAALLASTLIGWVLGLLMGAFRRTIGMVAQPTLNILLAVPALSWVLVSMLWMSNVELRVWFICIMIGVPLYAVSVYEGVRDLDGDLVEAIEQFRPNRWQTIYILLIPQSFVYLLISMRSVSSLILRILVFAELIGASTGVGARMGDAQTNFEMSMIFAWTVIMVLLNFVVVWLIDGLERVLLSWRREVEVR